MKRLLISLLLILYSQIVFCQNNSRQDKTKELKVPEILKKLSEDEYQKILNREFNSVINSSGKTTIGNYASADIKDGQLAFNATKNFKNGDMLSINASGSVTDGVFAIFTQSKINSNVGVNFKYNIRFNSSYLSYYDDELDKLSKKKSVADIEYNCSKLIYEKYPKLLSAKLDLLNMEVIAIKKQLENLKLEDVTKAKYEYQLALKNLQIDSILLKQQTNPSIDEFMKLSEAKKIKNQETAIEEFSYTGIYFHWISFGAGFQNNNFNHFDSSLVYEKQISKKNYVGLKASIEYNVYEWNHRSQPTQYLLLGISGGLDDNFAELNKMEINESTSYTSSSEQRTIAKKFNAYQGDYKTNLSYSKIYADYYRFFSKNTMAVHIYPQARFKEETKPMFDTGIGLLYSFKDSKKEKSKLHAELYFTLSDLTNSLDSELALLKRNEFGLRLSIPVSFLKF
ncbi:hypothetical protein ACM46_18095 [Chryseobacterium angstadtii]|uniref:Outer membrane protein beta-barrel domain-containing protein n=1 Tax=Chryseobacterium angstadtii TaxID=558151 RepID=A0A0J7I2X0_9FLAO|nr:hypothetical protein [Chryseobacterium angstadtii]KMQ60146.1 hypothetical protein ACM46_18095 [Chryseobacterium angstadtii]